MRKIFQIFSFLLLAYATTIVALKIYALYFVPPASTDDSIWSDTAQGLQISQVVKTGVAERAGLKNGDFITAIDGIHYRNKAEAQRIINQMRDSSWVVYSIRRGEQQFQMPIQIIKVPRPTYDPTILLITGFLFVVIASVVIFKRPSQLEAQLFFLACTAAGFLFIFTHFTTHLVPWLFQVNFITAWLAICFWPGLTGHFFLVFSGALPNRHLFPQKSLWLYLPGVVWFVILALNLLPERHLTPVFLICYLAVLLIPVSFAYHRITDPLKKKQLWTMRIGFFPFVFLFLALSILPAYFFGYRSWLSGTIPFLMVVTPLCFAYAILKQRLLKVEIFVRNTIAYLTAITVSLGLYFGLVTVAKSLPILSTYQNSNVLAIVVVLIVAVLFNPVKSGTQQFIDRNFFSERYNYKKELREFSNQIKALSEPEPLLTAVAQRFLDAMHIQNVLPFLIEKKSNSYRLTAPTGEYDQTLGQSRFQTEAFGLAMLLKQKKCPLELYDLENTPEYEHLPIQEKIILRRASTVLAVPLISGEELVGILNLGPKKSGDIFNQEDLDFLKIVSRPIAIAVANSRFYQEELLKKEFDLENQLARQVQQRFLKAPRSKFPDLDLEAINLPSKLVSGDLYAVTPIDNRNIGLAVGDVADNGMSAAVLMAMVQAALESLVSATRLPGQLLKHLNHLLYTNSPPERFVTLFYAILNTETRALQYANAGHNRPFWLAHDGKCSTLEPAGLPLGVVPETEYSEGVLQLQSGDLILLFTNGVTQATNDHEEQYGEQRLQALLHRNHLLPARSILRELVNDLQKFTDGKELEDDITLLGMKVK